LAFLEQIRGRIALGKLDECKAQVEEAKTQLDSYPGGIMDSLIYSAYHQTASEYHKVFTWRYVSTPKWLLHLCGY
jgi:hypothetical protein